MSNLQPPFWTACALLLLTQTAARAESSAEVVALVGKIEGTVHWKPASDKAAVQLDAKKDAMRPIHFGEWVKVSPGSGLHLMVAANGKPIVQAITTPANGTAEWRTFVHRPSADQLALMNVLKNNSGLGGRSRGNIQVYSPADGSAIRLSHLHVLWTPSPTVHKLTITILDGRLRRKFWETAAVDGAAGRLDTAAAAEPLKGYRGALVLKVTPLASSAGSEPEQLKYVRFMLLDPVSESSLEKELAQWDREIGLIRHLGKIFAFNRLKLYNEAADEYEAALAETADSKPLLSAAIDAAARIGNTPLEVKLRGRFAFGG